MNEVTRKWNFLRGSAVRSAFADISGWWRADTFTGTTPNVTLTDKSANGNNMVQAAGTMTAGTATNGKAKFTCSAANLNSNLQIKKFPYTIITIGKRSGTTNTCFLAHTTNTSNSLWFGYDGGSNLLTSYAVGSITNATADAGVDSCWVARRGYGCEMNMYNGTILTNIKSQGVLQGATEKLSMGSTYRGMNMDWQETMIWDRTLTCTELDEIHAYVTARYGIAISLFSSLTPVKQIIVEGQSNPDGRGDCGVAFANVPVAYRSSFANVFEFDNSSVFSNMNLSTSTYFTSPVNITTSFFGPDLTAMKDYADRIGENVYLFKYTAGGTSMYYTLADTGYWTHDHPAANWSDSRSQFRASMTAWWKMMRVHQAAGRFPVGKAFMFWQGEDDATDATAASQWSTLAQAFFAQSRAEMGIGNTKIFLVRIHNAIDIGLQPFRDTVIAQQDAAAAVIPNCQKLTVDSYGLRDGSHVNAAGQIAFGQFWATQI